MTMWDDLMLATIAADSLAAHAAALAAEGSPRGIDALDETSLHPVLARAFVAGGHGVTREYLYPGRVQDRPRGTERERCDLLLTPAGGAIEPVQDPVREAVRSDLEEASLFAGLLPRPEPRGSAPEDCYWLEVKTVAQYEYVDGVPGPNRRYASGLVRAIKTDLRKLSAEPFARSGALALVLFTAHEEVARHDVPIALHRALDAGVLFRPPLRRSFEIIDHAGNACCTLVWIPSLPDGGPSEPSGQPRRVRTRRSRRRREGHGQG
ncbi:MAG: hypothetical protein KF859_07925 [Phycisphaeraceae bacterium]|nr:hypothetical protein [Phycisphaeraceae bacterium]